MDAFRDERFDKRFDHGNATIICDKCGTLFSAKNIIRIGSRSIHAYYGADRNDYHFNYCLAETCTDKGHAIQDLRILTDEEYATYIQYKQEKEIQVKFLKGNWKEDLDKWMAKVNNADIDS